MILKNATVFSFFITFMVISMTGVSSANTPEKIPDSIVSMSSGFVIAVDKKNQKLYVFKKNGNFSKVFETTCSTGKNQGGKEITGDAKTPNGIFFPIKILNNPGPPETYGTLAFPLDFPTVMDKKAGRNGTNIWIHGTTKPLLPFQSNGCVVLSDKDIHALSHFIYINKTPVIIAETIQWIPQNQIVAVKTDLEKMLSSWVRGYQEGNMKAIDSLYLDGHIIKNKKRENLANALANVKAMNQHFVLEPRDISILHQNNQAVIVFDQITGINKNNNTFEGSFNKLTLQKINHKWFMIDDAELSASASKNDGPSASRQTMESSSREALRNLIVKWSESWQSGNMNLYRACYASNFSSQGMSLNEWINHKNAIRERSGKISIRLGNLKISGDGSQSIATFTQHYSSNLLKRKGNKRLDLRKINGEWKIYRETMQ
jgi:lipoprotein-anchoring transpeptidase ErfK/SrfK